MDRLDRIGFLKYAPIGRIYVVGDTVFVSPTRQAGLPRHEIGSFANQVKSYANQAARIPMLNCESPLLAQASRIASQLPEIRFCLTELLDGLRSRQSHSTGRGNSPPEVEPLLTSLAENVAAYQRCAPSTIAESSIATELLEQFCPPCGIFFDMVVPLTEVPSLDGEEECVQIGDQYFRPDHKRSKTLESVIQAIQTRVTTEGLANGANLEGLSALAETIVADATQLLQMYPSTDHGSYRVVYQDPCHQLQHNDQGEFMLVRGPLQHRLVEQQLYVGLHIRGKTRQQMLAVPPMIVTEPSGFWSNEGRPIHEPICMGTAQQYRHLKSRQFTNAEAVIQWLDAGVIVATARPEYHSMCQEDSPGSRPRRRPVPIRGGRRHA